MPTDASLGSRPIVRPPPGFLQQRGAGIFFGPCECSGPMQVGNVPNPYSSLTYYYRVFVAMPWPWGFRGLIERATGSGVYDYYTSGETTATFDGATRTNSFAVTGASVPSFKKSASGGGNVFAPAGTVTIAANGYPGSGITLTAGHNVATGYGPAGAGGVSVSGLLTNDCNMTLGNNFFGMMGFPDELNAKVQAKKDEYPAYQDEFGNNFHYEWDLTQSNFSTTIVSDSEVVFTSQTIMMGQLYFVPGPGIGVGQNIFVGPFAMPALTRRTVLKGKISVEQAIQMASDLVEANLDPYNPPAQTLWFGADTFIPLEDGSIYQLVSGDAVDGVGGKFQAYKVSGVPINIFAANGLQYQVLPGVSGIVAAGVVYLDYIAVNGVPQDLGTFTLKYRNTSPLWPLPATLDFTLPDFNKNSETVLLPGNVPGLGCLFSG